MSKAIILLSGGLDSAVMLALALEKGQECCALSFDYGQRHRLELESARALCEHYRVPHQVVSIDRSAIGRSELLDEEALHGTRTSIPSTYVPARNTLFLTYALIQAEIRAASEIWFGPNSSDHAYPDCLPPFVEAFQQLINVATYQGMEGLAPKLVTPLLEWDKKRIAQEAFRLNVPVDRTWSCYDPKERKPCGNCAACLLRDEALSAAAR